MAMITQKIDHDIPMISPECFEEFRCKGGACRNTCCQNWRIDISRAEYNKVRNLCEQSKTLSPLKDKFFQRMPRKQASDAQYATIRFTEDGYCPMFTEGGLCGLQVECGYQILPQICKQYPRLEKLINETEYVRGLDLSCEHTLELLWQHSNAPLHFTETSTPPSTVIHRQATIELFPDYASDIRNLCIWIMQNRSYSLSDRLLLLGFAVRELHKIHQSNTPEEIPKWFSKNLALIKGNDMGEPLQKIQGNPKLFVLNNLRFFYLFVGDKNLFTLFETISKSIDATVGNTSYSYNPELYQQAKIDFYNRFPEIDSFFENCIVMLMFNRVFPLSDENIWNNYKSLCVLYSLMQFSAISTIPTNAQELIDYLVMLFRNTTSSNRTLPTLSNILNSTESNSLAHLAILLRG